MVGEGGQVTEQVSSCFPPTQRGSFSITLIQGLIPSQIHKKDMKGISTLLLNECVILDQKHFGGLLSLTGSAKESDTKRPWVEKGEKKESVPA